MKVLEFSLCFLFSLWLPVNSWHNFMFSPQIMLPLGMIRLPSSFPSNSLLFLSIHSLSIQYIAQSPLNPSSSFLQPGWNSPRDNKTCPRSCPKEWKSPVSVTPLSCCRPTALQFYKWWNWGSENKWLITFLSHRIPEIPIGAQHLDLPALWHMCVSWCVYFKGRRRESMLFSGEPCAGLHCVSRDMVEATK